jgi:hypothetical protein
VQAAKVAAVCCHKKITWQSTNMSKQSKSNPIASSYWMKEVQRCIALSCLDTIYTMGGMKLTEMQMQMERLFHGNGSADSLPYVSLCLQGKSQFEHIWEIASENPPILQIKSSISRSDINLQSDHSYPIGVVSRSTLTGSHGIMNGRNVMDAARLALKNMKKALAFALEFLEPGPEHGYRSGTNESDLDAYVLKKMSMEKNAKPTAGPRDDKVTCNDENDNNDDTEEGTNSSLVRNEKLFAGWLAFKCFGPAWMACCHPLRKTTLHSCIFGQF